MVKNGHISGVMRELREIEKLQANVSGRKSVSLVRKLRLGTDRAEALLRSTVTPRTIGRSVQTREAELRTLAFPGGAWERA
jgi:hypothetical protein